MVTVIGLASLIKKTPNNGENMGLHFYQLLEIEGGGGKGRTADEAREMQIRN